jgi:hypothetical protein
MARSTAHKIRENRLRQVAARQGRTLHRCRRRDPGATGYGKYTLAEDPAAAFMNGEGMTLDEIAVVLGVDAARAPGGWACRSGPGSSIRARTVPATTLTPGKLRAALDALRAVADDPNPVVVHVGGLPILGGTPLSAEKRRKVAEKTEKMIADLT